MTDLLLISIFSNLLNSCCDIHQTQNINLEELIPYNIHQQHNSINSIYSKSILNSRHRMDDIGKYACLYLQLLRLCFKLLYIRIVWNSLGYYFVPRVAIHILESFSWRSNTSYTVTTVIMVRCDWHHMLINP